MTGNKQTSTFEHFVQLFADAELSFSFSDGLQATGLAVFVVAVIAIAFFKSRAFGQSRLTDLVKAWRSGHKQPPAE